MIYDWYTSDNHFGHKNITAYCNRPMNADGLMAKKWRARVGPTDTVLHLGDFALPDWRIDVDGWWSDLVHSLTGKIFLIPGNHDRAKNLLQLKRLGVTVIQPFVENGVWFTHKPQPTEIVNVHGHIHNNPYPVAIKESKGTYRNVSVEVTDYQPVTLADLLAGRTGNGPEDVGYLTKTTDPEYNKSREYKIGTQLGSSGPKVRIEG